MRVCVFDVVFISFFAISPDLMDLILFAGIARKDIYTVYIMEKINGTYMYIYIYMYTYNGDFIVISWGSIPLNDVINHLKP